jgi:hypothetical protein
VVNQAHPGCSDANPGTERRPLQTISAAARRAGPGDTVLVHGGVYRERVAPARGGKPGRPIRYVAVPGELVYVRGSDLWQPAWRAAAGCAGVFLGRLDPAMFGALRIYELGVADYAGGPVRPAAGPALARTRGQLFVDGAPLTQVETEAEVRCTPGTWIVVPAGGAIAVHFPPCRPARPPRERRVELTTRHRIFAPEARGLGHIHVDGFIFEHCANNHPFPQVGAFSTRGGHHWLIENCVIRHANTIGLDFGAEGGIDETPEGRRPAGAPARGECFPERYCGQHVIRNNVISDNGLCGICGRRTWGVRIEGNVLERNNRLGFRTWEFGAIKTHQFYDGLIAGNLVRDNDCFGIWLDNLYAGSRVTRNLVLNNYLAGIMVELGLGPGLVDNNVVALTRAGDGLYSHDASGVTIAHNLFYGNGNWGVSMTVATDRITRDGQPVRCSRNRVRNNLLLGNRLGAISLPLPWERAFENESDGNLVMGGGETMDEGTGVLPPLFQLNSSHAAIKAERMVAAFREALDRAGVPAGARPNLELWSQLGYPLDLDQWRLFSGNDRASATIKLYHEMLATRVPEFTVKLDAAPWSVPCRPVAGVDRDYLGYELGRVQKLLPGPFQHLRTGPNRIVLWPLPDPARLPPLPENPEDAARLTGARRKAFNSSGL